MDQASDILEPYYEYPDSDLLKLEIKQTQLPFPGLGLFATAEFQPNQIIAEYYGSILTSKCSESQALDIEDKLVEIDSQYCVLGRGPASRINDLIIFDPSKYDDVEGEAKLQNEEIPLHKGYSYNAKIVYSDCRKVLIKSTKYINPKDQIFMSYGLNYWKYQNQMFLQSQQSPQTTSK